jgi:hypothetical protein
MTNFGGKNSGVRPLTTVFWMLDAQSRMKLHEANVIFVNLQKRLQSTDFAVVRVRRPRKNSAFEDKHENE